MVEPIDRLNALRARDGDICQHEADDGHIFKVVDEDEWTQDHKYQQGGFVVLHIESGRHFYVARHRSGSYHSDWYYSEATIQEVQQVTKTIIVTEWEAI